jgi:hypothetical protein
MVATGELDDEAPTRASEPPSAIAQLDTVTIPAISTTVVSPVDALLVDEIERTRRMAGVGLGLVAFVGALVPMFGGDRVARWLLVGGLACAAAAALGLLWMTARRARFTATRLAVASLGNVAAVASGILYFGIFSPAPIVFVLGIYFVGLSGYRVVAYVLTVTAVVFVAIAGALIVGGVVADPGLIRAEALSAPEKVAILILVEFVLGCAFWIGTMSRRTALAAVNEHAQAVRAAAHREALLEEARAELERALRLHEAGRFTEQIIGSFRLGPVIGRGAMGEVYEAVHTTTGAPAAVKLLRREALVPGVVRRFLREAQTVAALDAPEVVRVLEQSDETAPFPYIAMELLRGNDLAHLLRQSPRMAPAEVVEVVSAIARGVDAAGAAGIVHRDLKPQNVFRHEPAEGGVQWKILDFGVSKLRDGGSTLTAGAAIGTPSYMAPEQAAGGDVDTRADVHALAVLAFRALTGELPYKGPDPAAILFQVTHTAPPRASAIAPLPVEVDAVLARGMAKHRDARYPTAGVFAAALAAALGVQTR